MKGINQKEGPLLPPPNGTGRAGTIFLQHNFLNSFSKWYPFVSQESLVMKQQLNKVIWVKQASEKKEGSVTVRR